MKDSQQPLADKVALVTGAGQGIGRAVAERLARNGAVVAVNTLQADDLAQEVVAATGGLAAPGDMSDPAEIARVVAAIETTAGSVDVLVVNHATMTMASLVESDPDDWWRVVDTNLSGAFHLVQAVLPGMLRAGSGRIVLVSSEAGVIGWKNATAYAASKAGMIALAKSLGRELASRGVLVNAVAPGTIDTPQLEVDARDAGLTAADFIQECAEEIPMGRLGSADEVASCVALLADPNLSAFVGQVLQVNGGSTRARA